MIPTEIVLSDGESIPVTQRDLSSEGCMGFYSECDSEIVIDSQMPEPQKVLILIHELIHVCETHLIVSGTLGWTYRLLIRRIWGERLVENIASTLFQLMGMSGMLTGVSPSEVNDFISECKTTGQSRDVPIKSGK